MAKLIALFTIVPLVELYLLLAIGGAIGFWPTVGIVVATAVVGGFLAKREGLRVVRAWQAALAEGRVPAEGVLGGVLVLLGGVLLVTPGVLTDLAGLALLFPPARRFVAARLRKGVEERIQAGAIRVVSYRVEGMGAPMSRASRDGVIDVEGEVVERRSAEAARLRP